MGYFPIMRSSFRYGLFASLSAILKDDMEKYLSQIVPKMVESLKSTEGVMVEYFL